MKENWNEALNQIQDKHIQEAIQPKKHQRLLWLGAVAAILVVALLLTSGSGNPNASPLQGVATLVAAAEYPEMVPYPGVNEAEWDSTAYKSWREGLQAQYDQPKGYADGLGSFFTRSLPLFLTKTEGNAVCSPLNLYMALSMLAELTGGDSREAVLDVLGVDSLEALRTQAGHVWNANYRADGTAASLLANSLWLDSECSYDESTVNQLVSHYYASVYRGDLQDPAMDQSLRDWLSRQTQGMLDDYISNVEFPEAAILTLASTVYFRDQWAQPFFPEENTQALFHSPDGSRMCTFLNQTMLYGPYYYGPDYGAVYLRTEDGHNLWLILPDEGYDPYDLLASGHALSLALDPANGSQSQVKVNLSLPKFDISGSQDLSDGLKALGLEILFDGERADFSAILPESAGVLLGQTTHAARVTIDEEGITATAYTLMAANGAPMVPEEEIDFVLDRPFLFILTTQDNLPLFAGIVNEP